MELRLNPIYYSISSIVFLTQLLIFAQKVAKHVKSATFHNQDEVTRKKKMSLLLVLLLIFTLVILHNLIGVLFVLKQYKLIYRSVSLDRVSEFMIQFELFYESINKSALFCCVSLIIPLLYESSLVLVTEYLSYYSLIRLIWYPLIMTIFYEYSYLKMFIVETVEISECVLLLFIFICLCCVSRHIKEYSLIETYEYKYIFMKMKIKCRYFILQMILELVCRCMMVYLMLNTNTTNLIDYIIYTKLGCTVLCIQNVMGLVFCEEQEAYDNLVRFTDIRPDIKNIPSKMYTLSV